jgi:hypothetical protein
MGLTALDRQQDIVIVIGDDDAERIVGGRINLRLSTPGVVQHIC